MHSLCYVSILTGVSSPHPQPLSQPWERGGLTLLLPAAYSNLKLVQFVVLVLWGTPLPVLGEGPGVRANADEIR